MLVVCGRGATGRDVQVLVRPHSAGRPMLLKRRASFAVGLWIADGCPRQPGGLYRGATCCTA